MLDAYGDALSACPTWQFPSTTTTTNIGIGIVDGLCSSVTWTDAASPSLRLFLALPKSVMLPAIGS